MNSSCENVREDQIVIIQKTKQNLIKELFPSKKFYFIFLYKFKWLILKNLIHRECLRILQGIRGRMMKNGRRKISIYFLLLLFYF